MSLTLTALEGLVARTSPALFVETSGDEFWLNYTAITYGLSTSKVTFTFVLQHFESYFTDGSGKAKIVVFDSNDPIAPAQEDMAITIATVDNALAVASTDLATVLQILGVSNIDEMQLLYKASPRNSS